MSILIAIVAGAVGAIIVLMLLSAILLWLWNTTIPDVFDFEASDVLAGAQAPAHRHNPVRRANIRRACYFRW